MENFDPELRTFYQKIKEEIKKEHVEYLKKHPEIREILNDFVSSLMLEKPDNIYSYAKDYFSFFNTDKKLPLQTPLVISGPSGCGKGTLLGKLFQTYSDVFSLSISFTTRAQRPGEIHGKHYYFVTKDEFETEIREGNFIEYVETYGNFYGTNKKMLDNILASGRIPILEIDVKGAAKLKKFYPDAKYIFINIPSLEDLQKRLEGRGTESKEQIKKRMDTSKVELATFKDLGVYHEIMNKDLETCYKEFVTILRKEYPTANIK